MEQLQDNSLEIFSNCLGQMVSVSFKQSKRSFYIDKSEMTVHIYEVFLLDDDGMNPSGKNVFEFLTNDVIDDLEREIINYDGI
jgi:hypothetical protein